MRAKPDLRRLARFRRFEVHSALAQQRHGQDAAACHPSGDGHHQRAATDQKSDRRKAQPADGPKTREPDQHRTQRAEQRRREPARKRGIVERPFNDDKAELAQFLGAPLAGGGDRLASGRTRRRR